MIHLEEAYRILFEQELPLSTHKVNLFDSVGRILAQDLICERDLPAFNHSAMDGYAIAQIQESYTIAGSIFAGETPALQIAPQECYKIMTGAKTPSNTLAIIPFESATLTDLRVKPTQPIHPLANLKLQGEECKKGSKLLTKGEELNYGSLALIASGGKNELEVFSPLKIALYSSGNEIVEPGEHALEHQIYNINAISYSALLESHGFQASYQGILPDDLISIQEAIRGFKHFDVVFTSGGASVGEADFFEIALKNEGAEILFHGIHLKPGRPMLVAKLEQTLIFALPGNPLSGLLNLASLALPALFKLSGAKAYLPPYITAKLKDTLKFKSGRSHMILGIFDGEYFTPYQKGQYGSGAILPLKESNAFAIFDSSIAQVEAGNLIKIIPVPFRKMQEKTDDSSFFFLNKG